MPGPLRFLLLFGLFYGTITDDCLERVYFLSQMAVPNLPDMAVCQRLDALKSQAEKIMTEYGWPVVRPVVEQEAP